MTSYYIVVVQGKYFYINQNFHDQNLSSEETFIQTLTPCLDYIVTHFPEMYEYQGYTQESIQALQLPFPDTVVNQCIDAILYHVDRPGHLFGPHAHNCYCHRCTTFLQEKHNVIEQFHVPRRKERKELREWWIQYKTKNAPPSSPEQSPPSEEQLISSSTPISSDMKKKETNSDPNSEHKLEQESNIEIMENEEEDEYFDCCESSCTGCGLCGGCGRGHCVCEYYDYHERFDTNEVHSDSSVRENQSSVVQ